MTAKSIIHLACKLLSRGPLPYPKPDRASIQSCILLIIGMLTQCMLAQYWIGTPLVHAQNREEIDFATQIRPILSDKCFKCHGPDKAQRATELRLDQQDSVHRWAIQAGALEQSELIRRIETDDPDLMMPPPDSKMQLSESERLLLKEWVISGAEFAGHWSFQPIKVSPPPELRQDSRWHGSGNPVDAFVGKRLEQLGLAGSPPADDVTLVRRTYLDLIGLPPKPEDVARYVASQDPQRYEKLLDQLLADERFGERWAIEWLDAARYADTHGYQADRYRATWPWRDWVVGALNRNMPYDQFITWQLAGDLLPNATSEQILATAFNRIHRQTNEGGSIEEEFRAEYVADRVNTFGAAFLGLTLECARCHDHKYDPIGQSEYYSLAAFFNNIDESGLYSHFTDAVPTPALQLSTPEQQQAIEQLKDQIVSLERLQAEETQAGDEAQQLPSTEQLREQVTARTQQHLIAHYSFQSVSENKIPNQAKADSFAKINDGPTQVEGVVGQAILLDGENNVVLKEGGTWQRHQPFTISMWLKVPAHFQRSVLLHRSRAWTDAASRGFELLIEDGRLSAALVHFWPGNAIRLVSRDSLPLDRWCHVTWTYDGSSRASGMKLWMDGKPTATEVVRDALTQAIHGGEANEVVLGQRFRDVGFKGGAIDELRIFDTQLTDIECQVLYLQDTSTGDVFEQLDLNNVQALLEFRQRTDPEWQRNADRLAKLREQLAALSDPIPEIMVMKEMSAMRPTHVLHRGQYDAPGDLVQRGTLHQILPLKASSSGAPTRLDLAGWLVDPQHPLTARVAVNRVWQTLFGRGLVATPEDFGLQGAAPTHPQLLDWLAHDFIHGGWDTKSLIKKIMLSQVYQQASEFNQHLLQQDPENQWLSRGPAFRLSAELLRDAALSASELLVNRLGGPPVKPYQPDGLWEEKSGEAYRRDEGEGSRRRSLYTFWKRTSPPPMMMTFDASSREVCVVRRQVTLTPLQTLVLLNDPQFIEASRALAELAIKRHADLDRQLEEVFLRLTSRTASKDELAILRSMFQQQASYFQQNPEAAGKFLAIGDHKADPSIAADQLAALTVVAEGLMSYDGFVMKR